MTQSEDSNRCATGSPGLHVAIIMDGSGRWAERRGWPRLAGHRAGVEAVRRVVRTAPDACIGTLTLFAFSGANWRRPASEAAGLMEIFNNFLSGELKDARSHGVQVNVIGRRDRLPKPLVEVIERVEVATARCGRMRLRLAIDYSAREALTEAMVRCGSKGGLAPGDLAQTLAEVIHDQAPAPDVDLLIRTGGEHRLSDCLLWEGAFAEIIFTDRLWPDFSAVDLFAAVEEFHRRERRFGGLRQKQGSGVRGQGLGTGAEGQEKVSGEFQTAVL
jgi:undecaprenyl diphosphate synthase